MRGRTLTWAIVLMGVGVGLAMGLARTQPPPNGPVGDELKAVHAGAIQIGYEGWVGKPITFEGDQIINDTGAPQTILSVRPTNNPPHVILRTGVSLLPPAQGPSRMDHSALASHRR